MPTSLHGSNAAFLGSFLAPMSGEKPFVLLSVTSAKVWWLIVRGSIFVVEELERSESSSCVDVQYYPLTGWGSRTWQSIHLRSGLDQVLDESLANGQIGLRSTTTRQHRPSDSV